MKTLKNQCHIDKLRLEAHPHYKSLKIYFRIKLEGNVCALWNGHAGRIKAHALLFGDDGNKGDTFLYKDEYPLKLSWNNQATLEEDTFMPIKTDKELLNEDKRGRDEIYALFYLTMRLETKDGIEVDAIISEVMRTNLLVGKF